MLPNNQARSPFVLKHTTSNKISMVRVIKTSQENRYGVVGALETLAIAAGS